MSAEKRIRSRFAVSFITVVAMVVLAGAYALSIGPMLWLATRGYLPQGLRQVLSKVYEPLWLVAGHIPLLKQFLLWYVGRWD